MIRQYRATIDRLTQELVSLKGKSPAIGDSYLPISKPNGNVIKGPEVHIKPEAYGFDQKSHGPVQVINYPVKGSGASRNVMPRASPVTIQPKRAEGSSIIEVDPMMPTQLVQPTKTGSGATRNTISRFAETNSYSEKKHRVHPRGLKDAIDGIAGFAEKQPALSKET